MSGRRGGRAIPAPGLLLLRLIRLLLDLLLLIILMMLLLVAVLSLLLLLIKFLLLLLLEMERRGMAVPGFHRRRLGGRTHGELERAVLRQRHGARVRHIGLMEGINAT